jgi:LPS sulfotransferase NodH
VTGVPNTPALGPDGITRFIVLCGPRTGSNMLTSALNSHPRIVCFREIFNFTFADIDYHVEGYDRRSEHDMDLRQNDPAAFLRTRIFSQDPARSDATGFKFMYEHFWMYAGLIEALQADTQLRVIHLQRENGLRAYLSYRMALATGRWQKRRTNDGMIRRTARGIREAVRGLRANTDPPVQVELSPAECIEYIQLREQQAAHFDKLFEGHPRHDTTYEAMEAGREQVFGEVLAFLGVEPAPLAVEVERQNPQPMRELIANYEELSEALAATPYAWMLQEPVVRGATR